MLQKDVDSSSRIVAIFKAFHDGALRESGGEGENEVSL